MITPAAMIALSLAATSQSARADLPADAVARRDRSIARLVAEQVPVYAGLPVVESETVAKLPSTEEIAMRAVATIVVAMKGSGVDRQRTDRIVAEYRLSRWLSPKEREFLADPHPTASALIANSWRYEAANALLWSLGFVDALGAPHEQCDPSVLVALIETTPRAALLVRARPRPLSSVLDQDDLIYRYRWALVDARFKGAPPPAGLNGDVALERHQALDWLVLHAEEAWDDVSLDT